MDNDILQKLLARKHVRKSPLTTSLGCLLILAGLVGMFTAKLDATTGITLIGFGFPLLFLPDPVIKTKTKVVTTTGDNGDVSKKTESVTSVVIPPPASTE